MIWIIHLHEDMEPSRSSSGVCLGNTFPQPTCIPKKVGNLDITSLGSLTVKATENIIPGPKRKPDRLPTSPIMAFRGFKFAVKLPGGFLVDPIGEFPWIFVHRAPKMGRWEWCSQFLWSFGSCFSSKRPKIRRPKDAGSSPPGFITLEVGDPYKASFATGILGWGVPSGSS